MSAFGSIVGAVLGGVGDFVTSLIGHDTQKDSQKDLMNWQNEYNTKMWERNNEYNTPANQMARLQEAGVNPNLAYANGNLTNISASSPTSSSSSAPGFSRLSNFAETYKSMALFEQELKNLQAEERNKLASANLMDSQADVAVSQKAFYDEQANHEKVKTALTSKNKEVMEQAFKDIVDSYKYQNDVYSANSLYLKKQAQLAQSEFDLNQLKKTVTEQEAINLSEQLKNIRAQRFVLSQQALELKYKNAFWKNGLNPNDPTWQRMMSMMIDNPEYANKIIDGLSTLFSNSSDKTINFFKFNPRSMFGMFGNTKGSFGGIPSIFGY